MSRELPSHPNLDHLKKQARLRLRDLQRHYPKTKLADAQHSIAREYGFASWPQLKTHVESLPERPSPETPVVPSSTGGMGGSRAPFLRTKGLGLEDVRRLAVQLLNEEPAAPGETGTTPA